jgi:hypothetical protein
MQEKLFKTRRFFFAFLIFLLPLFASALDLRLGVGQIYTEDPDIKGIPTHFFAETGMNLTKPLSLGLGARYINFGEIRSTFYGSSWGDYIPGAVPSSFTRKINGGGLYFFAMLQPRIGQEAKIAPYAQIASGFHVLYPTVKVEYSDGTGKYTKDDNTPSTTVPFVMMSAGCEIIFGAIGFFLQGSYIESSKVEYGAWEPAGIRLSPGGEVDPAGWQIMAGIGIH